MQFRSDTQCKVDIKQFGKKGKPISRGAYGKIYKVKDKKTNKFYAAKIITPEINKESLDREIEILMYANHPTIIKFFGFSSKDFKGNDNPTIIMEFAERGSLLDILNQIRSGEEIESYTNTNRQIILIGISRGMKYLHDRNIIHRDLKPGNVLLNNELQPLIADFGMSKFFKADESKNQSQHGGTLIYMAPEIIKGSNYDRKVDVYAFGILMFEVVTESIPYSELGRIAEFKGDITPYKFMNKVTNGNYRPKFDKTINKSFKELIEQCWSEDPDNRPFFSDIFKKLTTEYFFDDVDNDKITSYIKSITQIDDPIEDPNQKMEMIEKENKQLKNKIGNDNEDEETVSIKDNKAVNQKLLSPQDDDNDDDDDDDDESGKDDLVEETVKFKAPNSIHYKLFLSNLTAEVVESQEVKGDVFIPTFVDYHSKRFKVTKICDEAFKNSSIDTLSFSEESQVESIGNFAFKNSTIHKLYIPANLTKLNQKFAEEASNLTEIEVDKNNRYYSNESDFLIYTLEDSNEEKNDKTCEIIFSPQNFEGELIIPENITCIGHSTFEGRQGVLSVKSESSSLKGIKSYCFYHCENLTNIIFKGQTELFLGEFCFSKSTKLSSIEITSESIFIDKNCFEDCTSLSNINFDKIDKIEVSKRAFKGCTNLENVVMHKSSLITIGDECFADSSNLKSAAFIGNSVILGNNFIKNCPLLALITIESKENITISKNTFECNNLKNIRITTKSTLKLNDSCFNLKKLQNIELSYNYIDLGQNCFSECSLLTMMSIHCEKEIKIFNEFFNGCKALKKIILSSESNIFICDQFMSGSAKLESIEISGVIVSIGSNSFYNCQSLLNFAITKASQIEFKENQFINCNKLEEISIQCSIVNICQNQICNFKSLKRIIIKSTLQVLLKANCFSGFVTLENILISGEDITIEDNCFKDCSNLKCFKLIKAKNLTFGSSVFTKCTKLNKIDFKVDSNLIFGHYCFYGSNVRKAIFEGKVVELGKSCFENHIYANILATNTIEMLSISGESIVIKDNCFKNCTNLNTINFPKAENLTLKSNVFYNCSKLKGVYFKVSSNLICDSDCFYGSFVVKAIFEGKSVELRKSCFESHFLILSTIIMVDIIAEKVNIGDFCFNNCSSLKSFRVSTAKEAQIGNNAFQKCNNLDTVNFKLEVNPEILKNSLPEKQNLKLFSISSIKNLTIGNNAFERCNIESVLITADDEIKLLDNCFSKSTNLKTFSVVSSKNMSIGMNAFEDCNNLQIISMNAIEKIEFSANCFLRARNLNTFVFFCKEAKFDASCFSGCSSLTSFESQNTNILSFSKQIFDYCDNLEFIKIATEIEFEAGDYCFDRLRNLKEVIIDSPKVKIGDFCFNNCSSLTTLSFPTVKEITYYNSYNLDCINSKISINPTAIRKVIKSEKLEINKSFVDNQKKQ